MAISLFHHHAKDVSDKEDAGDIKDAASFEVLAADGKVVRYAREDFDEIFETSDPDEVQRQVAHGWAVTPSVTSKAAGALPPATTSSSASRACASAACSATSAAKR